MNHLIKKYNVPGPRYTSYPTVPSWENNLSIEDWKREARSTFLATNSSEGISLYIHLPFCESLCTYCGCNTRITVNHKVEQPYITAVLKEWAMYLDLFEAAPRIRELHLGGGTPTFFSPGHLKQLIEGITSSAVVCADAAFSFEAHPNSTSREHLQVLYDLGFKRVSIGVQDFDPKVQEIVNRVQSFETVKRVTEDAREIGYTSINFDLIYGLPLQTKESIIDTVNKVRKVKPDRIAFYSYAHVPWIKPGQRRFTELDLPKDEEKRMLYETGRALFEQAGYKEIGMDHFALPSEELYVAMQENRMHRNFMGYTPFATKLLVGLGVSSISDSWTAFAQNVKKVEEYYSIIEKNEFPLMRGHLLSDDDLVLRKHILNIMCYGETSWKDEDQQCEALYAGLDRMRELELDDLVNVMPYRLEVTETGKAFVRNICMALDAHLWRSQPQVKLFSQTV
jgi:oxygen-independent coproporphyrinogen-3 oxidase